MNYGQTNKHTNGRTDKRKDEHNIPVTINAGGIDIKWKVASSLIKLVVHGGK